MNAMNFVFIPQRADDDDARGATSITATARSTAAPTCSGGSPACLRGEPRFIKQLGSVGARLPAQQVRRGALRHRPAAAPRTAHRGRVAGEVTTKAPRHKGRRHAQAACESRFPLCLGVFVVKVELARFDQVDHRLHVRAHRPILHQRLHLRPHERVSGAGAAAGVSTPRRSSAWAAHRSSMAMTRCDVVEHARGMPRREHRPC